MDASAFNADADDDLSFADLYDELPSDVKKAIDVILFLARSLAKAGLLVAALACCAWAFALLLAWMSLFWLQTQLLLKLSTLLCICYEVRKEADESDKPTGSSPGREIPDECLKDESIEENQHESSSLAHHTSDEFDMFEAFLNTPKDSREHNASPAATVAVGVVTGTKQQASGTGSELEGYGDWERTDRQKPVLEDLYDELYDVSDSEFVETNHEPQQSTTQKTTASAGFKVVKKELAKIAASEADAKARALAKREEDAEKRAAEQTAWLERLKAGSFHSPKNRSSQKHSTSTKSAHLEQSTAGVVTQLPTAEKSEFGFTPEQLEEAARFAAEATRGHSSHRSGARPSRTRPSQPLNKKPSVRKYVTATSGPSQPTQQQHLGVRSRQQSQAGTADIKDASQSHLPAPSRSGVLPPHLRKKVSTADSLNGEGQSTGDNRPETPHTAQITITSPETKVVNGESSQQGKKGEDHAPKDPECSTAQAFQAVEHDKSEFHVQSQQQVSSVDTNPLDAVEQMPKPSLKVSPATLPRRVSIDDLMEMDQRECGQRLAAVVGNGNEHVSIRDRPFEPTPPLTKPAERSMSIQCLKALNTDPTPGSRDLGNKAHALGIDNRYSAYDWKVPTNNVETTTKRAAGSEVNREEQNETAATILSGPSGGVSDRDVNPSEKLESTNASTSHGVFSLYRPGGQHLQHQKPSPERKAALQQAVQALNKQAHVRRASVRTLNGALDAATQPIEPIEEIKDDSHTPRSISSGYHHKDLLDLEFATPEGIVPAPSLASRSRPPSLLRAEAISFFAPSQKNASQDDPIAKQVYNALSTSLASGNTSFRTPDFAGRVTFSDPSRMPGFVNAYASPSACDPFWQGPYTNTQSEEHPRSEFSRPATHLASSAVPIKGPLHPQPDTEISYNVAFPPLSRGTNTSTDTQRPAPPGLKKVDGVGQPIFDELLYTSRAASNLAATGQPFSGSSNIVEGGTGTYELFEVPSKVSEPSASLDVKPEEEAGFESEREQTGEESHTAGAGATGAGQESNTTTKKKKRAARAALRDAWCEREEIRKRVAGTWTLDGARSLEYATETYNNKRSELAKTMADNKLLEEDSRGFPVLSKSDLSVPRVWSRGTSHESKKRKKVLDDDAVFTNRNHDAENRAPTLMMTDTMLEELQNTAIEARKSYEEAHNYFHRPPPQGRAKLRDLRAQGEKRIELAAKRYRKKVEAVEAAYPNGLPAWLTRELWAYDDEAIKKSRDEWML